MPDTISLRGRVELIEGELTLRIPRSLGGDQFALLIDFGQIEGDYLQVIIPGWLAEKLRIGEGSWVVVDNVNGRFTITRSALNDAPES